MTEAVRLRDLGQIRRQSVPALVATIACAIVLGHFLAKATLTGDATAGGTAALGAIAVLLNAKEVDRALREVDA